MKINLSVVIITFNEEKNIERCIQSVKSIADEIVVVDSFSKDKTKEICLANGVHFFEQAFLGHIEQKNYAITKSSHPYILSLDADEALDEEAIAEIRKIKANWTTDAYFLNRLTSYCGKWIHHCGWYPDKKLRLWDSSKGKWGGVNPHDKFIMEKDATTERMKGKILHYSFHTINQHIQQINFFTDISSKAAFEEGKRSNLFIILFKPLVKFFRDYIFHLGFLDGYYGFVICVNSAHAKFLKYTKLLELQKQAKR